MKGGGISVAQDQVRARKSLRPKKIGASIRLDEERRLAGCASTPVLVRGRIISPPRSLHRRFPSRPDVPVHPATSGLCFPHPAARRAFARIANVMATE